MIEVSFRIIQASDAVVLGSWIKQYFDHDGLEFNDSVLEGLQELLVHPEYGVAWEIIVDDVAVGYCVLTYGFDHEAGGRIGVVTDLYVMEEARGQGVGTSTLQHCKDFGRSLGLKQIELFVLKHNPRAQKLYESLGFSTSEDREFLSMKL